MVFLANKDPVATITGVTAADSTSALVEVVDVLKTDADAARKEKLLKGLRLAAIINAIDLKILSKFAKTSVK